MQKSTYKKYLEMVTRKTKTWTKSEIDSFKNMMNRQRFSREKNEREEEIIEKFYKALDDKGNFCITREHSKQGINYLRKLAFKNDGTCRNLSKYPFTFKQVEILRNFKRFTFIGFHDLNEGTQSHYVQYAQIYRVHAKNGEYFDYCPIHWSNPAVLKEDNYGYYHIQGLTTPKLIQNEEDIFKSPSLEMDDINPNYKEIDTLFCDSSGFGRPDERALTVNQLKLKIKKMIEENKNLYSAITEAGQFQVYITIFSK